MVGRELFEPDAQAFPTEIMNDRPRGVIAARIVSRGLAISAGLLQLKNEGFEDFPQHFGVNGDFLIEGRIFADGEVVSFEQMIEKMPKRAVADFHAASTVKRV